MKFFYLTIIIGMIYYANGDGDPTFHQDYVYKKEFNAFYKFHSSEKSFFEAWAKCNEEDATIAAPTSEEELNYLKTFGSNIVIGLHDMLEEGTFTTIDGVDIKKIYIKWAPGAPDNYGDEDCVVLGEEALYDHPCYLKRIFVCKKDVSDINKPSTLSKVKFRDDYLYFKELDAFYKYHGETKVFSEAVKACESEGTQLLIPSSEKEIKFMKNYMLQVIWLGIHDMVEEGKFQTIDGKGISDLYIKWGPGEPNDYGSNEDCALLYHDITTNDITCDYLANFVCKIKGDTIRGIKTPNQDKCDESITVMNGRKSSCKGQIIFEENFDQNNVDRNMWIVEHRLPSEEQENGFLSYQHTAVSIDGNKLKITPTLQHNSQGFNRNSIINGELDLTLGCTSKTQKFCKIRAESYYILPPVISGRITTRNLFNFKYGRIEIRAKLPQGNWLYPELYLEPATNAYGNAGYESGLMRIAFSRGNLALSSGNVEYGNNVLSAGVIMEQSEPCRSRDIVTSPKKNVPWGNDFHVYGLTWTEDSITLDVDNEKYGTIEPPADGFKSYGSDRSCRSIAAIVNRLRAGSNLAPFDQEFYITIGLGVGGILDFPKNVTKPWKNTSPKAKKTFWNDENNWYKTWNDRSRTLLVDSIKVFAI